MEINTIERYALAKLSEHITSFFHIKSDELIWFAEIFDIKEYQDVKMQIIIRMTEKVSKEVLFNFLLLTYSKYHSTFPKLMEEILQKIFKEILTNVLNFEEFKRDPSTYKEVIKMLKNTIMRDLEVLGYDMEIDLHIQTVDILDVHLYNKEISDVRRNERTKLFNILEKKFNNVYVALQGAYERYLEGGSDAYRQAIDSCRNAYENFFKKLTSSPNWKDNLNKIIESKTLRKYIKETYSLLSGYGTHSPSQRKREDAFLAIRITEDILMRVIMEINLW